MSKRLEKLISLKKAIERQISREQIRIVNDNEKHVLIALNAKSEPFGVVHVGDYDFEVPKIVKYDQSGLKRLYDNEEAREFIKPKFDISETLYKSLPDKLKNEFGKYRSVEPGKIKVTYKG